MVMVVAMVIVMVMVMAMVTKKAIPTKCNGNGQLQWAMVND